MEIKWTTTISYEDLVKWAKEKYGSLDLFDEEYQKRIKEKVEEMKKKNKNLESEEIIKESDKTIFKDYICDEIDKEITKVESYSYYMEYDAYLVKYSRE